MDSADRDEPSQVLKQALLMVYTERKIVSQELAFTLITKRKQVLSQTM